MGKRLSRRGRFCISFTYKWLKNVLIDDLYVYHKRQASFGSENRAKQIEQNNPEFHKRWYGFREKYEKENNLVNPIEKIEKEMFGKKMKNKIERNPLEFIFSIKNSKNKKHKVITLVGMQLKIKR